MTVYLEPVQVLEIHQDQIDGYGGEHGIFASTYTFLYVNGLEFNCDVGDAIDFIDNLYEQSECVFPILDNWLRLYVVDIK